MPRYGWTERVTMKDGREMVIHFDGSLPNTVEKCDYCHSKHEFLCDWEISPGVTCDKKLCRKHTGKFFGRINEDYCPEHYALQRIEEVKK